MSDSLIDYRRKRARAEAHFKAVEQAVQQFRERERDLVAGEFDPASGKYTFEWPRRLPPRDLTLTVGDCIYNLRACLDYSMTGLVRSMGNKESYATEFPIYGLRTLPKGIDWRAWEQWWDDDGIVTKKLAGTPPETRAFLRRLQPLDGVPTTDPDSHPLALLQELSNRDKHRRLNLLVSRVEVTFVDALGHPRFQGPVPHGSVTIPETSESDVQLVTLDLGSDSDMKVYLRPAYDVLFGEGVPLVNRSVIHTLTRIREFIDGRVLETVRLLLGSRG